MRKYFGKLLDHAVIESQKPPGKRNFEHFSKQSILSSKGVHLTQIEIHCWGKLRNAGTRVVSMHKNRK